MFAHGQGFTSSGFGASKENTEALRTRSGTNAGHDPKRELLLSLQSNSNPLRSPPTQASAPGVLNPLYGQYQAYQDPTLVKQRKKGKKQRHANTSSSGGGGMADVQDPSILQARLHQGGMVGQGLYSQAPNGFSTLYANNNYGGAGRW